MCDGLMNYKEIFEKFFLESLKNIKDDRVPNVRIAISRLIRNHILNQGSI